jgi:hypothetical protein
LIQSKAADRAIVFAAVLHNPEEEGMTESHSTSTPSAPHPDWREARREERRDRLVRRYGWIGPGLGGFVLVLLGLIFLAQNLGYQLPESWWTVFLLIPACGAFFAAWSTYQSEGRLNGEATAALLGGITLTAIALAFIFGFNWGLFWPLVLIAVGGGILLRVYWR